MSETKKNNGKVEINITEHIIDPDINRLESLKTHITNIDIPLEVRYLLSEYYNIIATGRVKK